MRFKGLDLNLLVALNILLEERSVARASKRLNLSQPATSAALARLREFFKDEILIVSGKRMYATPFAEGLVPYVAECLQAADTLIATSAVFNPATSRRTFRIVASDYTMTAVFVPLIRSLGAQQLAIRLDFMLPDQTSLVKLETGEIDLIVTPQEFASASQASELLFEERHVIVGCRDNEMFRGRVTEEAIFERGHIALALTHNRTPAFSESQLEILGKIRHVEITVSSFTLVPWLLMGTERLALMHERLARAMQPHFPITFAPLPFPFPIMRQMIQFHRTRTTDDGLRWLIGQIRESLEAPPIIESDRNRSSH